MMSATVWEFTFAGTCLAAATVITLACFRAYAREDRRRANVLAQAREAVDALKAGQALETEIELAYLRGAVAALNKAAQALADHPDFDPADALRQMADQIILDRPAVWS